MRSYVNLFLKTLGLLWLVGGSLSCQGTVSWGDAKSDSDALAEDEGISIPRPQLGDEAKHPRCQTFNRYSCSPDDPCNWIGDGFCDENYCRMVRRNSDIFDDARDCGREPAQEEQVDCGQQCEQGQYTSCTCGATDPCRWAGDRYCDSECTRILGSGAFDDSADCNSSAPQPAPQPEPQPDPQPAPQPAPQQLCSNDCNWHGDGECDDGGEGSLYNVCAFGTDCTDCGPRPAPTPDPDPGAGPDPTPQPGGRSFIVTAVNDNLDPNDMYLMADGLRGLGFTEVLQDRNVSTSELRSYLSRSVTTLYHTGHGSEGLVATSDGALRVNSGGTFGVTNAIFATCLTLTPSWASAFGPNTESILGYTKVSFDGPDDTVVRNFVDQLRRGNSHMEAWYLANMAVGNLSDRWAGYVREGGSIVEYSARSGRTPKAEDLAGEFVQLGRARGLFVSTELLSQTGTAKPSYRQVRVNSGAAVQTQFEPDHFNLLEPTTMDETDATDLAERYLRNETPLGLPAGAVLDEVFPVQRCDNGPNAPCDRVGYVVRYGRQEGGLWVRGNAIEDHIAVVVGPDGGVAASWYWPGTTVTGSPSVGSNALLSPGEVALFAADELSRLLKGVVLHIVNAAPVYGTFGRGTRGETELLPAYELIGADGSRIIVSAIDGRLLL